MSVNMLFMNAEDIVTHHVLGDLRYEVAKGVEDAACRGEGAVGVRFKGLLVCACGNGYASHG